jgi:hypothetical protein
MSLLGTPVRAAGRGIKGYFGLIGKGAKGALGVESIRQAGQMTGSVVGRLRMKTCPRCLETSMVVENGVHTCMRTDICGLTGTADEIQAFREKTHVDPRLIALGKGFTGHFDERARGLCSLSRVMWVCATLIGVYGMYWLLEGNAWTFVWTLLVGLLCAIKAVRYSYTARRLLNGESMAPMAYLKTPSLWFL